MAIFSNGHVHYEPLYVFQHYFNREITPSLSLITSNTNQLETQRYAASFRTTKQNCWPLASRSGPRMYTRKFTRMYTRTACRSFSYVHADKFTTTRERLFSAEKQGKQRRAACAESASSGRWPKQAGYKAMLATTRVSAASVCCLLSFGLLLSQPIPSHHPSHGRCC